MTDQMEETVVQSVIDDTERYELAVRTLAKFHELAHRQDLTEIERDALIQRFEFTFELVWKCAKASAIGLIEIVRGVCYFAYCHFRVHCYAGRA